MSTMETAFGRRVELVNFDKSAPVPGGFIFKLADELTPPHITNRLCQLLILEHILDVQTLHAYDLVFADDRCRELVLIVSASISNAFMKTCHLEACLCTILRSLLLLCFPPFGFCQVLLIFGKELGVPVGMPIAGANHALETEIKPNHLGGDRQRLDVCFHKKGDKVAIGTILGDCHRCRPTVFGQGAAPDDGERFVHLGEGKHLAIPLKGRSGIGSGLIIALLLKSGVLGLSLKEIAEGFIEVAKRLLKWNRRDFIEPYMLVLLLESGQPFRGAVIVETLSMLVVRIGAFS